MEQAGVCGVNVSAIVRIRAIVLVRDRASCSHLCKSKLAAAVGSGGYFCNVRQIGDSNYLNCGVQIVPGCCAD